eukprot:3656455-Rhodomonas_salina.2
MAQPRCIAHWDSERGGKYAFYYCQSSILGTVDPCCRLRSKNNANLLKMSVATIHATMAAHNKRKDSQSAGGRPEPARKHSWLLNIEERKRLRRERSLRRATVEDRHDEEESIAVRCVMLACWPRRSADPFSSSSRSSCTASSTGTRASSSGTRASSFGASCAASSSETRTTSVKVDQASDQA